MNYERKQQLYLDGLQVSFEYISHVYSRIYEALQEWEPKAPVDSNFNRLILDCWVLIDMIKRMRTLLENTPGLKNNSSLRIFINETKTVPTFRHYIQHLETEAQQVADTGRPIWGTISWSQKYPDGKIIVGMYAPGRVAECKGIPLANPAGRKFFTDIDHIELSIKDKTVNISELVRRVQKFSVYFNDVVKKAEAIGNRDSHGLLRFEVGGKS